MYCSEAYQFDGFVVSDCDAVETIYTQHHYTKSVEETVALALHAGTDLDCGNFYRNNSQAALDNKTIVQADIDQALTRTFNILVRLGYFDPPEDQPYRQLSPKDVDTDQSRQLALDAAQQSIVLLKNVNNALPLNIDQLQNKRIAIIGPAANVTDLMQGNYYGRAPYLISPLNAFLNITQGHSINISYTLGCKMNGTDESGFAAAIELARNSDVVIYFGGMDQSMAREGHDRLSIDFADIQLSLIEQLEQVVHSPLHVVIMSGSSLDLTYIRDSNKYGSLIWMGYAGQSGGTAIANAMFGQYNPGGRLPITFYPAAYVVDFSMRDMQMRPSPTNAGRSYKFYTGQAVYEFGHGLSYTTFSYSWYNDSSESMISIESLFEQNTFDGKKVVAQIYRVNVTNTGPIFGNDVVLGYVTPPTKSLYDPSPPLKRLFGFERVRLDVNQTTQVFFPLNVQSLLTVAQNGTKWLEPGSYKIIIGKQHMHTLHLQGTPIQWSSF